MSGDKRLCLLRRRVLAAGDYAEAAEAAARCALLERVQETADNTAAAMREAERAEFRAGWEAGRADQHQRRLDLL